MPVRRRTYSRRRTTVGTRSISARRPTRDVPIYSYVRPSSRRLTHITPVVESETLIYANNKHPADEDFPNAGLINPVAQGDGIEHRHATKIYMKYLFLSGWFGMATQMGTVTITSRFAVVYDKTPTGSVLPTPAEIFDYTTPHSFPTILNRERFELMYTRVVSLSRTPLTSGSTSVMYSIGPNSIKYFRVRIPIMRIATWGPNAVSGALTGMTRGALYVYFLNATPAEEGDSRVVCGFYRRLTFDDVE